MDTFRIILPELITFFFSLLFVWIVSSYLKSNFKDFKPEINKVAWIITFLAAFFSVWWLIALLSVNQIPRSTIDRTLNNQIRNNFEDRMISDTTKHKK